MDPRILWLIVAVAAVALVATVWFVLRKRRTERLRQRFGPEYTKVVKETGDVGRAEATLDARAQRVERLHIRPLTSDEAARFNTAWRDVQQRFVDDPKSAVSEADRLVGEVMNARGYPLGDFDQRAADISVDHSDVVTNYRAARDIAQRHAQGKASTEDLRQGMVHYRSLFRDLLEIEEPTEAHKTTDDREYQVARGKR